MTFSYCLDTSGFSNPLMHMPEDIHKNLWNEVILRVNSHKLCWNHEIAGEMEGIAPPLGEALKNQKKSCGFEIGQPHWDWSRYLTLCNDWRKTYRQYISEDNGNRKNTIGLNDLSIVALAKTLQLPLISMESRVLTKTPKNQSKKRLHIPDLCNHVGVTHMEFNDFLRSENIQV